MTKKIDLNKHFPAPKDNWIRCGGKCVCCDLAEKAMLTQRKSIMEEVEREIERYFYESASAIPYPDPITQEKHILELLKKIK